MTITTPPLILTFAASDPTGGAGLQADLLTFACMGCHGLSVVTGLTAQDTSGVERFDPLDAGWIADQARLILEDMRVSAFKLGVLGSLEIITVVADILGDYPDIPVVFDPVLASARGDTFATEAQLSAMRRYLLPRATVVTPNSMEVRRLADHPADADLGHCAAWVIAAGAKTVLVTGTHEASAEVVNTLYGPEGIIRSDTWDRLPKSYHGSGCTLASAIAALLANGMDLPEAVREAQEFTWQSLSSGFRPGRGQHLPDRMFWAREMEASFQGDASAGVTH